MSRLPPLRSLITFNEVAKTQSVTKASENLFVTQSAVSQQLRILEDYVGFSLFERKNNKIILNKIGEKCAKRIDAFETLSVRVLRFIKSSNPFISFLYVLFDSGTSKYCFPSAYRPSGHLKWVLGNPEFLSAFEGFPVGASKTNAA